MNEKQIWNKFLDAIKEKISPISYDTWFKDTYLNKIEENKVIAVVPMEFHKKNLSENYKDLIVETFNEITGTNFDFEFLLENEIEKNDNNNRVDIKTGTSDKSNLNPKTFK